MPTKGDKLHIRFRALCWCFFSMLEEEGDVEAKEVLEEKGEM